ncbi:zinc finger protein ozf [Stylonychia lemnae]|uniref:Zinc finger protein ozf n=1 Tax=Stylonychia lemnae TaxID=5949 RepID=A0A077ZYW4_STYLE|nr:zinc finger protein ozf [Stylonychia lemnae]|eukprot:CDW74332.1 zinc finger protein ozf [Stylonychia lemnae]
MQNQQFTYLQQTESCYIKKQNIDILYQKPNSSELFENQNLPMSIAQMQYELAFKKELLIDFQKSKINNQKLSSEQQNLIDNKQAKEELTFQMKSQRKRGPRIKDNKCRIFKCDLCDVVVTRKDNLLKHKKNIHFQEKQFQCGECFKQFTEKGNLVVHLRIHQGIKPYKCEICGLRVSSKGNYLDHCKRHFKKKQTQLNNHLEKKHKNLAQQKQVIIQIEREQEEAYPLIDYDKEVLKQFFKKSSLY